ncbi:glycosyl transferase family 10 (putative fucosyltransferase) [Chitinophaga niastensis]|uniref:Glycosyl transferase family 10 (Putative fucosyltransferase) n=2 Tax=Chitinophaga niastensis TaxID=536980 RepID=A0A2P8HJN8_CHINA|nr:glycosyl transferase family 10 (putative fucosyltransferase) [Chitinophaga niastensis]
MGLYRESVDYAYHPDDNHIEALNFWTSQKPKELWLYQFIVHHFSSLLDKNNSLLISSVFGPKKAIKLSESRVKLFYTGENLRRFPKYKDHCKGIVDIAVGFDYVNEEYYQRFPIWIDYSFQPTADSKMIKQVISGFVNKDLCADKDKKFASLVCSHDKKNIRTNLFRSLSKIDKVASAGRYLNNTNELKEVFNDDKGKFIGSYKFNICPENTNKEGYVTEKIFDAIKSNTIPIYWGSNNNPEPDVLNKDAILFYDGRGSLASLNKQVEELHHHPRRYADFINQPKFQPHAAEYIADCFNGLHSKIHKLLTSK